MTLITSPASILEIATAAMQSTEDERLKTLVTSLTQHLHQFVLENQLTELEFERALQFIVGIGQATGKNTNEVVLAADILGVSSLEVFFSKYFSAVSAISSLLLLLKAKL